MTHLSQKLLDVNRKRAVLRRQHVPVDPSTGSTSSFLTGGSKEIWMNIGIEVGKNKRNSLVGL